MARMVRALSVMVVCLAIVAPARADADPAPGSSQWQERDRQNMLDATGRMQDEAANPHMAQTFWTEAVQVTAENAVDQAQHPTRPVITASRALPGEPTDPYRRSWEGARGIRVEVEYQNREDVRITGNVWGPKVPFTDPVTGARSNGPFPGVVITTGSIQGYEEMYWWAAQGLAEAGYIVMTYDVQGQGESETFAHRPDGSLWCAGPSDCPGVPFQQAKNFFEGTEDAVAWFLSDANPLRGLVASAPDGDPVLGLAGHSLGAGAVSEIGNRATLNGAPNPVDAVVGWDNASLANCDAPSAPAGCVRPRVPTMGQNAEYFFNPQPTNAYPAPRNGAFREAREHGVASMQIALRASTHLEWTFVPYILPASREGERVAMHYTLGWFDRWLVPARAADARARLTAQTFDDSADASAIGMGAWDPARGNVPHTIAGDRVADHLSFYYDSSYAFDGLDCADLRRAPDAPGCAG